MSKTRSKQIQLYTDAVLLVPEMRAIAEQIKEGEYFTATNNVANLANELQILKERIVTLVDDINEEDRGRRD